MSQPGNKVSIITVVLNAQNAVRRTLESVKEQSYDNIEYIVIDGGSSDETLDILDSYADIINIQISEKDEGIYDAMNKGVRHATGDYIAFLNAGDVYTSSSALENVFVSQETPAYDVIYGANYYKINDELQLQKPRPLSTFYQGMPFNHQSTFVRSGLLKQRPFKSHMYSIQCEYDFFLGLYADGYKFHETGDVIAVYESGGFSDQNFLERALERWLITKRAGIDKDDLDEYYGDLVGDAVRQKRTGDVAERARTIDNEYYQTHWARDVIRSLRLHIRETEYQSELPDDISGYYHAEYKYLDGLEKSILRLKHGLRLMSYQYMIRGRSGNTKHSVRKYYLRLLLRVMGGLRNMIYREDMR